MRRFLPLVLLLGAIVGAGAAPGARAATPPPGTADLLAPLLPAVVNIKTVTTRPGGHYFFWGSGFIIEPSGVIVTNRHVVAGANKIIVTGRGFTPQLAKVLYISDMLDLAILKIDVGRPLPVLAFGDSDTVRIGDPVLAIGNPLGIGESVSAGIVSALDRNIRETIYDDFIQTDAAINHGNSGGPMLDAQGKVVAIDTALDSSPHNTGSIGVGFAMPANDAKFIVDQVIRVGHVQAGWIGVHVQHMTESLARGFALDRPRGVLVAAVDPAGPAAGKVREGDVLLQVAAHPVTDSRGVQLAIAEWPVGQAVPLMLLRDGAEQTVPITVAPNPADGKAAGQPSRQALESRITAASAADPGMRLSAVTPYYRRRFDLGALSHGVVVTEVLAHSAATDRGIVAGDVILRVRQDAVNTPVAMLRALDTLIHAGIEDAPLLVQGPKGLHWVALPLAGAN